MDSNNIGLRIFAGIIGVLLLIVGSQLKSEGVESTGSGCDNAHIGKVAAASCRHDGWVIRPRLAVGPHGVVRRTTMPHCPSEDAGRYCTWNVGTGDGNGRGAAFWVGKHNRAHYVWASDPTTRRWRWVKPGLADALAESEAPRASTRDWTRCVVRFGPTTTVRCPDGVTVTS